MIDYLVKEKGLSREQAYTLVSVAVDLNIAQLVDVPNSWVLRRSLTAISSSRSRADAQAAAASPLRLIPEAPEATRVVDIECGCGGICSRRTQAGAGDPRWRS